MRTPFPLAILLLLAPGCGGPSGLAPQPASGLVRVGGKPADGVLVRLHARGAGPDAPIPNATTGPDGRFALRTSGEPGAPEGPYAVTLTWPPPMGLGPPGRAGSDRLGGRYADPGRPFAEITIRPGPNELGPFDVPEGAQSPITQPKSRGSRP